MDYKRYDTSRPENFFPKRSPDSQTRSVHTTLFVNNLPPGWPALGLRKIFSWHGTVKRVYIPKKLSKSGLVFGFVTLHPRKKPDDIIKALNRSWLGNRQITVCYAKPNPRYNSTPLQDPKARTFVNASIQNKIDNRSYAAAVKMGKTNLAEKTDTLKVPHGSFEHNTTDVDTAWLRRSLVGWLHNPLNLTTVQDKLLDWGILDCICRPMGGNLVLLSFASDVSYSKFISNDCKWLAEWFDYFKPWEASARCSIRYAWIRCEGVPLHAWNPEFFAGIASLNGSFICLDDDTRLKNRLDIARLLISTPMPESINKVVKPKIDGVVYSIRIVEEPIIRFPEAHRNHFKSSQPENSCSLSSSKEEEKVFESDNQTVDSGNLSAQKSSQKFETPAKSSGDGSDTHLYTTLMEQPSCPVTPSSPVKLDGPVMSTADCSMENHAHVQDVAPQTSEVDSGTLSHAEVGGADMPNGGRSLNADKAGGPISEKNTVNLDGDLSPGYAVSPNNSVGQYVEACDLNESIAQVSRNEKPNPTRKRSSNSLHQSGLNPNETLALICSNQKPNFSCNRKTKPIRAFYLLDPIKSAMQFPNLTKTKKSSRKKNSAKVMSFTSLALANTSPISGVADASISDSGIKNMNSLIKKSIDADRKAPRSSEGDLVWDLANQLGLGGLEDKEEFIKEINRLEAEDKAAWDEAHSDKDV